MTDRSRNVAVGFTAVLGMVLIIVLLMLFGYLPTWLQEGYELRVRLPDASGLAEGSRVKLSGIDIGRVTSVRLEEPPHHGTVINVFITEAVRIPLPVRVKAEQPLLGGSPSLAFVIDEAAAAANPDAFVPTDGSAVIEGEALTMVSQFAGELQAAMAGPTRVLERAGDNFEKLSGEWVKVGSELTNLIEQRTLESVDTGQAIGNLTTVLARADQRLRELQRVIEGMERWVNDPELRDQVMATVANARDATEKLNNGADRLDGLITSARDNVESLSRRYVAVADDVAGVVGSLRTAVDKANTHQGMLGKLLNDPALYDNLNDAAVRLEKMLKEGRLLIEKWKAEGLPVQF